MRGWWRDLADLVLPADCAGCGAARCLLCPGCREELSGTGARRVRPCPEPVGLPVVHAAASYGGAVRSVLLSHKERGALALAEPLGAALAGAVHAGLAAAAAAAADGPGARGRPEGGYAYVRLGEPGRWNGSGAQRSGAGPGRARGLRHEPGRSPGVVLVAVPSSRGSVRARGHDPVRRIALAASARLRRDGGPARVLPVLRQRRAVADQAGLGGRQRQYNLAGALEVRPGAAALLEGAQPVLVDDLMTTGATLAEAARAWCEAVPAAPAPFAAVVAGPADSNFEPRSPGTRTEQ
ncbi:ComF family protein [Streptomyces bambusae]|uniref:ComF family protein n=1 Tax=Streptomyces bambusae TaxID=1550616 RepID=UPI002155BD58|nr:ComF family protein [Streptomyces bambusae]